MPLFVHIVFWAFFAITQIGFIIFVIYSWAGGIGDNDFDDWIEKVNKPDPTNIHKKDGNLFYRWSGLFAVAMAVGITFGAIIWLAGGLQIASWIYGWGV